MADLIIKIGASAKQFQDEMNKVEGLTNDLKAQLQDFSKVGAVGFATFTAAIGLSVREYAKAEAIGRQTNAILKATGGIAGVAASEIDSLSKALADVTTFSDEAVKEGENILLTFTKIGSEVFPQATEASLDLAARMGGDAAGAAQLLGKALQRPVEGLSQLQRQGITFTETQERQIKAFTETNRIADAQKIILDQVASSIGGLARAQAGGLGVFTQLAEAFGDIAEGVGSRFAPALEAAGRTLLSITRFVRDNETVVSLLAAALAAGAVTTGLFTASFVTATVVLKAYSVITALSAAGTLALGTAMKVAFSATIIGLVVTGVAVIVSNLDTLSAAFDRFKEGKGLLGGIKNVFSGETIKGPGFEFGGIVGGGAGAEVADPSIAANRLAQEQSAKDEVNLNLRKERYRADAFEVQKKQLQGFQGQVIELSKQHAQLVQQIDEETNLERKEILEAYAEQTLALKSQAYTDELIQGEEFAALLSEQTGTILTQEEIQKDLHYQNLQQSLAKNILTEKTAKLQFQREELTEKINHNNRLLVETERFGKAIALIKSVQQTTEYQNLKGAFGDLEALTRSKNETLKSIGKAAAIASIGIKTAEGALNAYNAFSFIPLVGPALGFAAAGAIIAFGAEQIGNVTAAADGGILTGGIPGRDSIPVMAMPGELMVPTRNFDETVNAVADARNNQRSGGSVQSQESISSGSQVVVEINLAGDASRLFTARQIEDRALGISREAS